MAAGGSRLAVTAAIGGNTLVMIAKFVAFGVTGSGAMLSEGIHTLADVMNQILLLVGIVRSERDPSPEFQYGYGQERFVWALISAVGIFFLGCGVTIYHGISSLLDPHPITGIEWALWVLLFALVVEGAVLYLAYRPLKEQAEAAQMPLSEYLRKRADPSAVAVLLEDAAACTGVLIAMLTIFLYTVTGDLYWDALGSITIGLLLGAVAVWLVARNRELLIGQAAPRTTQQRVRGLVLKRAIVEDVVTMKSKVLDTSTYDVTLEVEFDGARLVKQQFQEELAEAWQSFENESDFIEWAARFADDVVEALGDRIDQIEAEIIAADPSIKHIDIEPD